MRLAHFRVAPIPNTARRRSRPLRGAVASGRTITRAYARTPQKKKAPQ